MSLLSTEASSPPPWSPVCGTRQQLESSRGGGGGWGRGGGGSGRSDPPDARRVAMTIQWNSLSERLLIAAIESLLEGR
jgi:hypothetical protein